MILEMSWEEERRVSRTMQWSVLTVKICFCIDIQIQFNSEELIRKKKQENRTF